MPNQLTALSEAQIDAFIADGFVRIDNAFSSETAAAARAILWRDTGCDPSDRTTWTRPVVRLGSYHDAPFREAANTPIVHAAYDQIAGEGRWLPPQGLGTFPVRFPSDEDPGDAGWHVDVSFGLENPDFMEWRANVKSSGRALLMLFLFSDVGPDDAPTRIRIGSHGEIARQLLPYGDLGATLRQLSADGYAATSDCEETLATGPAGTVYLCHPFLVHAAQPHRGTEPRFMAQPPLVPTGEFDPALPPSPVQIAIRKACGLAF
ncbi:phytanoyl-CoA dioxygenase family protein [Pelagibacterium xiamenense]|uniref:phytanoyl-CoA dioxygenase family protein n=1 Tax=Pelagibacterium xiamenense TaxID=2901140 RepID=UPI001E4A89B4|nr:phytanoyl-CoA dioxygenase family protein [Pelagibacterium xiamenense]MCD7060238.1 phytanoyl-CoA dioxygenase family protein [Pelagibacterium xiamenense]